MEQSNAKETWDRLAESFASSRQGSADKLIEWPAQLELSSPFFGKRVLDVGCGTGADSVLERCEEPTITSELRNLAAAKADWMDRYVGIAVFRLRKAAR